MLCKIENYIYLYMYIAKAIYIYILHSFHIYIYIYLYTGIYIYIYIYIPVYIQLYIYIYIYIYRERERERERERRCNGRDNTKKLCGFISIPLWSLKKVEAFFFQAMVYLTWIRKIRKIQEVTVSQLINLATQVGFRR